MNREATTLEQQISDALQQDATFTSAVVAALVEQAEVGIAEAEKEATVDRTLALDPKAARQAIADAAFGADRLRMLLSKLQVRCREVRAQEQAKAWLAEYNVMKRKRDALAEELCEVYPKAANEIMDLFFRLTDNDKALSALHQARPAGVMEHLVSAELQARRLDRFTRDTPSLLTSVSLSDFDSGRQVWPPRRPPMAAAFAAAVPAYDNRRFSADWAQDNDRRAAAQRAEQQRVADFYSRATREQEERENREARERFAASQRRNST